MSERAYFLEVWERYKALSNGDKAALRKVTEPDDLKGVPAFYRLFPEESPHSGRLRVAFILPWCDDCGDDKRASCPDIGRLLVDGGISDVRLFHVVRARSPADIIQFRRVMIQLKHPTLDWQKLGSLLNSSEHHPSDPPGEWFWNREQKRQLVEKYFRAKTFSNSKGVQ